MRTRQRKHPPQPNVEREMSDLGGERRVRFGLALKFMLPVTLATALLIFIMGLMAYRSAAASLLSEVDHAGIFAAKLAAAPELDSWDPLYNTTRNLYNRIGAIEAQVELSGGSRASSEEVEGASQAVREKIAAYDAEQERFNKQRLRAMVEKTKGALDVLILEQAPKGPKLKAWASNRARSELQEADIKVFRVEGSPKTLIRTGKWSLGDKRWVNCRMYQHPIRNQKGKQVGFARVVFSVAGMRAGLAHLRGTIILFCVLAILGASLTALAGGLFITRPLKALLKDIRSVASGDLEHRTRAHSDDEIGVIAQTFDRMTRNLQAAEAMRVDLADKDHQLLIASEVQSRLFPEQLPSAGEIVLDAANRLASTLSSDLFDAITLKNGHLGCLVMTASGRGFPAAIILSMARSTFRASAAAFSDPAQALVTLNGILSPDLRKGMYVAALYAIIDPESGSGKLASAGHRLPALHYLARQGGARKVAADGIAFGLDKGPVFESALREASFKLAPGDKLILATEGGILLKGNNQEPLGQESFFRCLLRVCKGGGDAKSMIAEVGRHLADHPGPRDLTIVVASRAGGQMEGL